MDWGRQTDVGEEFRGHLGRWESWSSIGGFFVERSVAMRHGQWSIEAVAIS